MAPVTACTTLHLLDGTVLDDAVSSANQASVGLLEAAKKQDGFQCCYWGREVENDNVLRMFTNWKSLEESTNCLESECVLTSRIR